jgi:SAM-dependent methyltransferase
MTPSTFEPGSFRDRTARVFYHQGEVFRGLTERALEEWRALSSTQFYRHFSASGVIISTEQVDRPLHSAAGSDDAWAAVLRHEPVPFISYPYEWSFSMLQDAALLQLDLLLAALDEEMTIKDASAFNIQWKGVRPVFVDVASFQRLLPGETWVAYRQFCRLFLYPLLLQAYRNVPFQPWLRGNLDGIDADVCRRLLCGRDYLKPGVLTHVYLQARAQAAYASSRRDVRADLRAAGFDTRLIRANATRLRALITGLKWKEQRSVWSEYERCGHYEAADAAQKRDFVRRVATAREWNLVWDLGCNLGTFSRLAAERARYVVALDADHLAVDRFYRSLREDGIQTILPLVGNLADPSPDLGWRNLERQRLTRRGRPDLVLCLALIHHLVISANIPLTEFLQWLGELGADLVIEFVTRDDPMVRALLRNKDDQYTDYDQALFDRELASRFTLVRRQPLGSGTRILYYARAGGSV